MISRSEIKKLIRESEKHCCLQDKFSGTCVKIAAVADLPSRFGKFQVGAFYNNKDKEEHAAFIKGNVIGGTRVPTRLHSQCLTGDAIGSLRCDCHEQLKLSLKSIGKASCGIILYLRQEGRGIGFVNKIKAYALQDEGLDTIEADKFLGFSGDEREYNIAAHMLFSLGIKSVKLMTNNPRKIEDLIRHEVVVNSRIPLITSPNKYNRFYLETKRKKSGHLLDNNNEIIYEQAEEIIVKKQ